MLNKLKELREANEEGFTLIELLVVIVIIGILAAIALPIFLNQQKAAIGAGVKSDVKSVQNAVATYLVKKPTATDIKTLAEATTGTNEIKTAATNVSDTGTTITIVGGAWNNYKIVAKNTNGAESYAYDSTTGKYLTGAAADALAPAPVTP